MATVKSEGKSGFLKEFFMDHPDAGKDAIEKAWREFGHDGSISPSLIHKVRAGLGLTGKARKATATASARTGKQSSAAPKLSTRRTGPKQGGRTAARANGGHVKDGLERPTKPRAAGNDLTRVMIRLEGQIDEMLHEIKLAAGLPEFEEALRKARRILARSHGD
jgi:hypothetical protein